MTTWSSISFTTKNKEIEHRCFDMDYKIKNVIKKVISLLPYDQTEDQFMKTCVREYVLQLKRNGVISKSTNFPNL